MARTYISQLVGDLRVLGKLPNPFTLFACQGVLLANAKKLCKKIDQNNNKTNQNY